MSISEAFERTMRSIGGGYQRVMRNIGGEHQRIIRDIGRKLPRTTKYVPAIGGGISRYRRNLLGNIGSLIQTLQDKLSTTRSRRRYIPSVSVPQTQGLPQQVNPQALQPQVLEEKPLLTPMQKKLGEALYQRITPLLKSSQAFTPTSYEMAGLEMLKKGAAPTPVQTALSQQILATLQGGYSPYTSPYYQAMRQQLEQTGKEAKSSLLSTLAQQGLIGETTNVRAALPITELQSKITGGLGQLIAQVAERERERQLRALPYAVQLAEMQQRLPMQRAELLVRYGGLPRKTALLPYQMATQMWGRNIPYGVTKFKYQPLFQTSQQQIKKYVLPKWLKNLSPEQQKKFEMFPVGLLRKWSPETAKKWLSGKIGHISWPTGRFGPSFSVEMLKEATFV